MCHRSGRNTGRHCAPLCDRSRERPRRPAAHPPPGLLQRAAGAGAGRHQLLARQPAAAAASLPSTSARARAAAARRAHAPPAAGRAPRATRRQVRLVALEPRDTIGAAAAYASAAAAPPPPSAEQGGWGGVAGQPEVRRSRERLRRPRLPDLVAPVPAPLGHALSPPPLPPHARAARGRGRSAAGRGGGCPRRLCGSPGPGGRSSDEASGGPRQPGLGGSLGRGPIAATGQRGGGSVGTERPAGGARCRSTPQLGASLPPSRCPPRPVRPPP